MRVVGFLDSLYCSLIISSILRRSFRRVSFFPTWIRSFSFLHELKLSFIAIPWLQSAVVFRWRAHFCSCSLYARVVFPIPWKWYFPRFCHLPILLTIPRRHTFLFISDSVRHFNSAAAIYGALHGMSMHHASDLMYGLVSPFGPCHLYTCLRERGRLMRPRVL